MIDSGLYAQIFDHLDGILKEDTEGLVVAIDGDAASGKTTLSNLLKDRYQGTVIHTDHFYLPFEERSDTVCGHMNIKKMLHEVLIPHALGKDTHYEWFDPHINRVRSTIYESYQKLLILEGSYSMHPNLQPYIDVKIYLSVSPDIQHARILSRSSAEVLTKFISTWIPQEKKYQETFQIRTSADITIDTSASTFKEIL
jgi:uridine kinase